MKWPPFFHWLYAKWMQFSHVLGRVMSFIILTIFWLFAIGLYAIVFKVIRFCKKKTNKQTYWENLPPRSSESMRHQF